MNPNQGLLTHDPAAVTAEVQRLFQKMFPESDLSFVSRAFGWAIDCFKGRFKDYLPVDTRYHDFEHTLQGTLCFARIHFGRHEAKVKPPITEHYFELGLLAILLHDTGYLKRKGDKDGTGAKYTATHVARSVEFAAELLTEKKFSSSDIRSVQNMIRCTGVDAKVNEIPFQTELEKITGCSLGTADLVGQMAAEDYVQKLPILYDEFAEAAAYDDDETSFFKMFSSPEDLMEKTPAFWEKFVLQKLNHEFAGMYRFLNSPYPEGPNFYLSRIEANLEQLNRHTV